MYTGKKGNIAIRKVQIKKADKLSQSLPFQYISFSLYFL